MIGIKIIVPKTSLRSKATRKITKLTNNTLILVRITINSTIRVIDGIKKTPINISTNTVIMMSQIILKKETCKEKTPAMVDQEVTSTTISSMDDQDSTIMETATTDTTKTSKISRLKTGNISSSNLNLICHKIMSMVLSKCPTSTRILFITQTIPQTSEASIKINKVINSSWNHRNSSSSNSRQNLAHLHPKSLNISKMYHQLNHLPTIHRKLPLN